MWPDNADATEVFEAMGTQWRTGFSGPVGLDYNVLPIVLRLAKVSRPQWAEVFESIRVMEAAALETMSKLKPKAPNG